LDSFRPEQRKTAREQRTPPLFLHASNCRRARISAEKEMPAADNLRQKQQKQREGALRRVTRAFGFVKLMNAPEH
jgi:hypothetical protein